MNFKSQQVVNFYYLISQKHQLLESLKVDKEKNKTQSTSKFIY